jgi:hypothetical protein
MFFTVPANERVTLIFDLQRNWIGFAVANGRGGYNQFDLDKNWVAFWVPSGRGNYNIFGHPYEWIAFTT